jgi:L-threonylcarbamoyladenylate synthase
MDFINILKKDGVGVIATDTIYGIVASAMSEEACNKVKGIKGRDDGKGFIVLISSVNDLEKFDVVISEKAKIFMQKFWPGKLSIVFNPQTTKFNYLSAEYGTIAFRFPNKENLIEILRQTGPLIAPSANPQGFPPAKNIEEAKKYFESKVDFYLDEGELSSLPSTLVKIVGDDIQVLREGAVNIV